MIDVIRIGHAASAHGTWIAEWVKEQLLHDHPAIEIRLYPVTKSLNDFANTGLIASVLSDHDLVVTDGSFVPAIDDQGVVVAAVCERADPRHCIIGDGSDMSVWHPGLAKVLSVTDPSVRVSVQPSLIDVNEDITDGNLGHSVTTIMPMHAISRVNGQRLKQLPIEAEDILPVCGQGTVLVYSREAHKDLGTLVFENLNSVDSRREVTVERYFKSQLHESWHDNICCYSTGSDRFLYLFVTLVADSRCFKTRSGAHISALGSIVEQAIVDLEQQSGLGLRKSPST